MLLVDDLMPCDSSCKYLE